MRSNDLTLLSYICALKPVNKMKKVFAFIFVCGFAAAVVSCGQKAENTETAADTSAVVEPAPVVADTTVVDSATVAPVDTTAN